MKIYIIKTRIRNIRYEMIDYEYSYSVGELEPFYQGLTIFRGRNLFEKNYDYYIVNEDFEDHFCEVFVVEKDTNIFIQRDKNMYFVVFAMEKYNYRPFPGKDRETEWNLRLIILAVLDTCGNLLSKDDMYNYIAANNNVPYLRIDNLSCIYS